MDVYLDFDNTLFNTDKLFDDIISLCESYGIDKKYMLEARKKIIPFDVKHALDNISKYQSFDKSLYKKVDEMLNDTSSYVFDDVNDFIDNLNDNNYKLHILTCGAYEWQNIKVKGSKLDTKISDVIITSDKGNIEKINYETSIFIDDNPKHLKIFLSKNAKKVIRLNRDDLYYSNDTFKDNRIIVCKNLKEVKEYLI